MTEQLITGATIFRKKRGGVVEWLVLKSGAKIPGELPKGQVRRGESSVGAILRMLREERGMVVTVLEESGKASFLATRDGVRASEKVIYYLIEHSGQEGRFPEEKWAQAAQASKLLGNDKERKILSQAKKVLKELSRKKP